MDIGTRRFYEFQSILLEKSRKIDSLQKKLIELLSIQYQMEDYINSDNEKERTAGDFLKSILRSLNIPQNRFADYIGLKPSNLSKLIKGRG